MDGSTGCPDAGFDGLLKCTEDWAQDVRRHQLITA